MKKHFIILICTCCILAPAQTIRADPITEVIKAAITKIIKAMDLAVQRLQNETIKLQNIQKTIENTMAKLKLQEISDWAEKQYDIFNTYYDELKKVRDIIAQYQEVRQMIQAQTNLVNEYKKVFALLKNDTHFTPKEINYMEQVYTGILDKAATNVDLIITVIKSFSLQMSDAARLELINNATAEIRKTTSALRQFSRQNILLSIERARDEHDEQTISSYYNIP